MLRKLRILLAACTFTLITLLFLDISGALHAWFGWLAKIQLVNAWSSNLIIFAAILVITFLLGRVYCSFVCPLGILQDIVSHWAARRKKARFGYKKACNILRYSFLGIFILGLIFGVGALCGLLEPYSIYGRIASNLFSPLYLWGNNLLAMISERVDSYAFYPVEVYIKGLPTFLIALALLVLVVVMAWRNGRTYCNTICPVGSFLGLISRFSLMKPVIDTQKCINCGVCAKKCKASCIDPQTHTIDHSRCVACFDCLENCSQRAIAYTCHRPDKSPAKTHTGRRAFLSSSVFLASAGLLRAQEAKMDGGLAPLLPKVAPKRAQPLLPAGSYSAQRFASKCTGCQLCVQACPNQVLRPSANLLTLMQPSMSYERGYCRPECTTCSNVCPSGAIRPITRAQKSATQIGHAVWSEANCLASSKGVACGHCATHCPTGAITLRPYHESGKSSRVPSINVERCIGCGACENLCPVRPVSAILVEGHISHREI